MLDEKKAQSSPQQSSADPGRPKAPKTKSRTCNSAVAKTNNHFSSSSNAVNPAHRFALLLERGVPPPVPGPLTSPLLGLTGGSLLIGQQAASLRLAQLKAQLALTQINTALTVGSRAANLQTPPSPTAAAINLLNLLKVANTMSHPLYNPYASGNQSSNQGQYGLSSIQAERDPRMASPHLGPASNFSCSSATSANSGGMIPSLLPHSQSCRPEQSSAIKDEAIERSIDMPINRVREEVRSLGKQVHQPIGQGTRFTSTQRDEFLSSSTSMTSYPMTSASLGHRHSDGENGSSSLDWLPNYKQSTADDSSKFYSSAASSSFACSGDGRFNASSERERDMQSIPGLGDYVYPVPDKRAAPTESCCPKYTSESAAQILSHFGLDKEDLEYLISYPEDQITPANLPLILRQIRIQKAKRATTAVQSKPYPEPQPTRGVSGMDSLSNSGGAGMRQEEMSAVLQSSKVTDYGHTGKYAGGVVDEIGRTSGRGANSGASSSILLVDTYDSSNRSQEPPQKNTTEVKSSVLGSQRDQGSCVTSSSYSSKLSSAAPPSNDPAKRIQSQPNQTSQKILSSFSLPKKDTDIRVIKSDPSKPLTLKEPKADGQSSSKTQPSCTLFHGVHPGRPGLVLIGSNNTSGTKDQSKSQGKGSIVGDQMKKQQPQQQMQQQQKQKQHMQQQAQKQPVPQMGQTLWPPGYSAAQPVPPASLIPSNTDASRAMQHSMFMLGDPRPIVIPPAPTHPIQSPVNIIQLLTPSNRQHPPPKPLSKGLPTPTMMHDYAAATPRVFPHTCSLCYKECTHMKDWLSHQNTSLHLERCKVLRAQYPEWNGEIILEPSAAGKDVKPSSSTSAKTSQHRHQKTRHGSRSRSRSPSPRRHHERREKHSRSRSPHISRYARSSPSRSCSPRYDRPTSSRYRSRSRSFERRLSPRRRDEKRFSPRRNEEWWSSPRSRERRSPRRVDKRRSSPRRSRERRSSTERSSPQRKRSSSAERLAKKLLEKSAVQSLSKDSDLKALVKTLAPALLAELAKMKSSSSSSSSPPKGGKCSQLSSAGGKSSSSSSSTSSSVAKTTTTTSSHAKPSQQKSEARASTNTKAIMCFKKEDNAKKLKSVKSCDTKEMPGAVSKKQITTQQKPAISSVSKPQTTKSVTTSTPTKNCLPTPHKTSVTKPLSSPSEAKKASSGNVKNEKTALKGSAEGSANIMKAKVLESKAKNVLTQQLAKTTKSAGWQKETAKVKKSANLTADEPTKRSKIDTETKVLAPKEEITSNSQKPKTLEDNLIAVGAMIQEKVEETAAKAINMPSKSMASANRPKVENSKCKLETKVQESVVVLEDTAKVVETGNAPVSELTHQADLVKDDVGVKEAKDPEPMELGETGVEVAEPMEVESCVEVKGEQLTNAEAVPDKSSESQSPTSIDETRPDLSPPKPPIVPSQTTEAVPKPSGADTQSPQTIIKAPETSVKASSQVQQSTLPEPESTAQGLETKTDTTQMQQQAASNTDEAALETDLTVEGVARKTMQKDPAYAMKIQRDPSSAEDASKAVGNVSAVLTEVAISASTESVAAVRKQQVAAILSSSAATVCELQPAATSSSSAAAVSELQPTATSSSSAAEVSEPQSAATSSFSAAAVSEQHLSATLSSSAAAVDKLQLAATSSSSAAAASEPQLAATLSSSAAAVSEPQLAATSSSSAAAVSELQPTATLSSSAAAVRELQPAATLSSSASAVSELQPTATLSSAAAAVSELQPAATSSSSAAAVSDPQPAATSSSPAAAAVSDPQLAATLSSSPAAVSAMQPAAILSSSAAAVSELQPAATSSSSTAEMSEPHLAATLSSSTSAVSELQPTATSSSAAAAVSELQPAATLSSSAAAVSDLQPAATSSSPAAAAVSDPQPAATSSSSAAAVSNPQLAATLSSSPAAVSETQPAATLSSSASAVSELQPAATSSSSAAAMSEPHPAATPSSSAAAAVSDPQLAATLSHSPAAVSEMQPASTLSSSVAAVSKPQPAAILSSSAAAVGELQPVATLSSSAAAVSELQPAATTSFSAAVTPLTIGEMVEKHLHQKKIQQTCFKRTACLSQKFFSLGKKLLLITNLPRYSDGCYIEEDLANLLIPFGFKYQDDNIYVFPQARMAFALMPTVQDVHKIMSVNRTKCIFLKGSILGFDVMRNNIVMSQLGFYKSLMKQMNSPVVDDGESVIYIKNVSPSEAKELREALKKIDSVRNYMPLLNKVFIEFESNRDADRLGVWYSLLKQAPAHRVYRLKTPRSGCTALPPRLAANAIPDSKDVVAGTTVPTTKSGVPQGSISPFWVTLTNSPFVFPTMSPWFIIPDHLTVRGNSDIARAKRQGSVFSTIMLTGLPEGNYKHEDVAKLVWPYFPKQNLHSLYYNVIVLTLQRRAFVYFSNWTLCCNFVRDHIINPVSVRGSTLRVHFVLEHMHPEPREELMYKTLMKWSNARVPDLESLEERLLCVEISETTVDVVKMVMEMVASIAAFVSFLPLANRICIEMADSSGVTQVVEKYNTFSPDSVSKHITWSKVQRLEPLKSLKQRLEDSSEITINLEQDTVNVDVHTTLKAYSHKVDFTDDTVSSYAYLFEEQNFNEEEFVAADDVGDKSLDHQLLSSSKPSSDASYTAKQTSASSSSLSPETPSSPGQKAQQTKTEFSVKASNMSSSICKTRSSFPAHEKEKVVSAAAVEALIKTHPELHPTAKAKESTVAKSDHKVSSEDVAAKTVESGTKIETSSEMHPPEQGQGLELGQAQSLENHIKDKTHKDKSNEKRNEDDVGKHEEEEDDDGEHYQILDSLDDQIDEQMDDGDRVGSSETQPPEPEKGQSLHEETYHVSDSIIEEGKACPEECHEKEMDVSFQVVHSGAKDQDLVLLKTNCQEDSYLVKDFGSKESQLSEEDMFQEDNIADKFDDKNAYEDAINENANNNGSFQVLDTGSKQGPRDVKTQDMEKHNDQIPNDEDQPLQVCNNKGALEDLYSDMTAQETVEILDSIDDQTAIEDDSHKLETPCDRISKEDIMRIKEEEDTYQVTDSVEDQPTTTETESEADNTWKRTKKVEVTSRQDDRSSKRSSPRTRASKSEEEKSPKKQDRTVKKYETRTKTETTGVVDIDIPEEIVYERVDSVEDELVQDAATTERSGRIRSARGKKEDKMTSMNLTEASDKPDGDEEASYEILDSVEDKTVAEEPSFMTRSTRGRRERTTKRDASNEKTTKEETKEEELKMRQAATKEKQLAKDREKEREERKTREREERERERRSRSRNGSNRGGGEGHNGRVTRKAKERGREKDEKAEADAKELVTLDEMGADEAGAQGQEWDGEITEGELQMLITLDEFVEEEEEGKDEQSVLEPHPPSKEDESVDSLTPETLVILDEAGGDEEERADEDEALKISRSAKRKHDDDTEDVRWIEASGNYNLQDEFLMRNIQSQSFGESPVR
ncbi:platelet binding protein GspB-like isoform X2 [Trachinotus anak]|uniref:platelet binding protein GspB-like isoform X2 n=1 Tax=Trachinotus anak TaxID=443729 RepID=UPI0039F21498